YNDCLAPNAYERFAVLRRRIVGHSLKLAKIRKWNCRWLVLAHLFENSFAAGHDFFPLLLLTRYHSANELPGASGISRCLYHGFHLLLASEGIVLIIQRPIFPAVPNRDGELNVLAIAFIATAFDCGA